MNETNERTARKLMIPLENLTLGTKESLVKHLFMEMVEKDFTNIPIIDRNHLCGILREKTALQIICGGNIDKIDCIQIQTIEHLVSLEQVCIDRFYEFVAPTTSIAEIITLFSPQADSNCRFDLVIVTSNGKLSGNVLGIITPWDLIKL